MECLGLHSKPKAEVHPEHLLTDPKEEEEEEIKSSLPASLFTLSGCLIILKETDN
jgi:hypothetical protein